MWAFVMFDLPVYTKKQKRIARDFRNALLDEGFNMAQFSVYLKFCGNRDSADALCKRIEKIAPESGAITFMTITDKQYEHIKIIRAPTKTNPERNQLLLL